MFINNYLKADLYHMQHNIIRVMEMNTLNILVLKYFYF